MDIREVIKMVNQMQADGVIERYALDAGRFQAILARHGLVDAWQKFERQFLSDAP